MYKLIADRYGESRTRNATRVKILEKAFNEFMKHGLNRVTMLSLSEVIEVDRKTLYRYYENKEELIVDITLAKMEGFKYLNSLSIKRGGANAYEKLKMFLNLLYTKGILEHKDTFLYLTKFDHFISELPSDHKAVLRYKNTMVEMDFNKPIIDILKLGLEDGSLKVDKDSLVEEANMIIESIVAVAMRFYLKGDIIEGLELESVEKLIDILINAYKR